MNRRIRNSPAIKDIIREYMLRKGKVVTFDEIYDRVCESATLISKRPRASVYSVLYRMPEVERDGSGKYTKYRLVQDKRPLAKTRVDKQE